MSDFKDDLKNDNYQVEVASDTNAAEPLETKFACMSLQFIEPLQPTDTPRVALGRWQAARLFWKCMVFCMILNWAALNDGVSRNTNSSRVPTRR